MSNIFGPKAGNSNRTFVLGRERRRSATPTSDLDVVIGCHHLCRNPPIITSPRMRGAAGTECHLAKAIHTMIRVLDETRSIDFYRTAFGLEVADRLDFETFTLVYLSNAESRVRTRTDHQQGSAGTLRPWRRLWPLAVSVADLDAEHERLGGARPRAEEDRRIQSRRRAVRPVLLHRGPRRLQDRSSAACEDGSNRRNCGRVGRRNASKSALKAQIASKGGRNGHDL